MYKDIINTQNIWQVIFLKGLAPFFFHRQMIFFSSMSHDFSSEGVTTFPKEEWLQ